MTYTPAQQMMIDDGFPPELFRTAAERAADWKGVKLSRQGSRFGKLDAAEQRQRNKLRREYERAKEMERKARFEKFLESRR